MRASTFFCRSVWAIGMNSSLETTRTGTGVGLSAARAGASGAVSLSLNRPILDLRQWKRGITLVQNASIDFISFGCGTRAL